MIVVGESQNKRTIYMKLAAEKMGMQVSCISYRDGYAAVLKKLTEVSNPAEVVKLDPPQFMETEFEGMKQRLSEYREFLKEAGKLPLNYLNAPKVICEVMDKRLCKQRLMDAGIDATEMVFGKISSTEELLWHMEKENVREVFIKPSLFSGAAGVSALRRNPRTGQLALRTTCFLQKDQIVNTKKLFLMEEPGRVRALLDALFLFEPVIERWISKEKHNGYEYDLRVVWQFGQIAHIVVRQSKGPVTNLHLNNQPEAFGALGLSDEICEKIRKLCQDAAGLFPGLRVAGMDVLLERKTKKPRMIEINGQGDLIYQDIYGKNRIYGQQLFYSNFL